MLRNSKLKNMIELSSRLTVYVPSTKNINEVIDNTEYVNKTASMLSEYFGGATATEASGYWTSDDILVEQIVNVTRFPGESTRVKPFQCYNDLKGVLDYFWNNKQYDCWLIGWLCALEWVWLKNVELYNGKYCVRDRQG